MHAVDCARPQLTRLMWLYKSGEPPGHPDHNIGYDSDALDICPECNGATLERLRHDCFDFEDVWDQYEWYELAPADGPVLRDMAAQCGEPLNPFCRCQTHRSLTLSMRELPASSWSSVFDEAGHRHRIVVRPGQSPRFALDTSTDFKAPNYAQVMSQVEGMKRESLRAVFVVWPLLFALSLFVYYRSVHVAWPIDVLVTIIEAPATLFVSVVLVALWRVITGKKPPTTDVP